MRKRIFGRKLKRDKNARKMLFRSLMSSLVLNGRIKTTEAKAKSIKGEIEKMVTHAKRSGEEAKRILLKSLADEKIVDKIIKDIAPKFKARPGGYLRILKLGPRLKDNAKIVILTWVEDIAATSFKEPKRNNTNKKKEVKKESKRQVEARSKKSNKGGTRPLAPRAQEIGEREK